MDSQARHEFQVLSFEYDDYDTDSVECDVSHAKWRGLADSMSKQEEEENEDPAKREFLVKLYGRDRQGRSVCAVSPAYPYFYVSAPPGWLSNDAELLGERIYLSVCRFFPGSLVACEMVSRKLFMGFHGDREFPMYKLIFRNARAAKICANRLSNGPVKVWRKEQEERQFTVFEGNVDPILRFIHGAGIESTGWISVPQSAVCSASRRTSRCDYEYRCRSPLDLKHVVSETIAPLVVASYDIEVYSPDGSFPSADVPDCCVTMIATTVQRYGEESPFLRHVVTLKQCLPIDGVEVESYDTEHEVLEAWSRLIARVDPDVLTGYNIHGFDSKYVFSRARMSGASEEFYKIGKDIGHKSELVEKTMSSNAYGHNEFHFFSSPGILQLDVLTAVKRDFKLDSYKLNNVAKHFLGEEKIDLLPKEIFAAFREGTPESVRRVAEYAVQDTALPLNLIWKLNLVPNMTEMAKVTGIPCDFLMKRGQQIRVYSLVLKYAMNMGYVLPTNKKPGREEQKGASGKGAGGKGKEEDEDEGYTGATVLSPKTGAYMTTPIACLDFASKPGLSLRFCCGAGSH